MPTPEGFNLKGLPAQCSHVCPWLVRDCTISVMQTPDHVSLLLLPCLVLQLCPGAAHPAERLCSQEARYPPMVS